MKNPLRQHRGKITGFSRLVPVCLLLFLVFLLVGFVSGFPTGVLRDRLVQEINARSGLVVSSDFLEVGFPANVEFDLTVEPNVEQLAPLIFQPLRVQPVWSSLFSEPRVAVFSGRVAEGKIDALVGSDDHLQLTLQGVRLGPLQKNGNPFRFGGVLSGTLDGNNISQQRSVDAIFSAEVTELMAFGLEQFSLPERLVLGRLALQGRLRGQRLNLEQVNLDGDFVTLSGNGTIQIGATPRQTRLNLRVVITPGESFPDSLKPLIELSGIKPKADGSYQLRIAGSMAVPVVR